MDMELTREDSGRANLRNRLEKILADISAGRIAHVEIEKKGTYSFRKGAAVIAGKSGITVMIEFYLFNDGHVSVSAAIAEDYFGSDLSWRNGDPHGRSADISREFQSDINKAMTNLKLGEVAMMSRPLRWLNLRFS